MDRREKRAREVHDSIREVLIREWDPIHIQDVPESQNEYDAYVGGVHLLASGASQVAIAGYLVSVERESMGLSTSAEALLPVARRLRQLNVQAGSTEIDP